jgi:hypothetical protein
MIIHCMSLSVSVRFSHFCVTLLTSVLISETTDPFVFITGQKGENRGTFNIIFYNHD